MHRDDRMFDDACAVPLYAVNDNDQVFMLFVLCLCSQSIYVLCRCLDRCNPTRAGSNIPLDCAGVPAVVGTVEFGLIVRRALRFVKVWECR